MAKPHFRSSAMSLFDGEQGYTTSSLHSVETTSRNLSCTVINIKGVINIPHLHLAPPFKICSDFSHRKTKISGLSRGMICVILYLAVSVMDGH